MVNFFFQFKKYFKSSVIAASVNVGTFLLFTSYFKINYIFAEPVSFFLGLITNYILNTLWVFEKRTFSNRQIEFSLYLAITFSGLLIGILIIWFLVEYIFVKLFLAKLMQVGIIFWWNFLLKKYLLFSGAKTNES